MLFCSRSKFVSVRGFLHGLYDANNTPKSFFSTNSSFLKCQQENSFNTEYKTQQYLVETSTFEDDEFSLCYASEKSQSVSGGGIAFCGNSSSDLTIQRCTFTQCTATGWGGGVFVKCCGEVIINSTYFFSCNSQKCEGGGLFCKGATDKLTVEDCTFGVCSGYRAGGGCAIIFDEKQEIDSLIVLVTGTRFRDSISKKLDSQFEENSFESHANTLTTKMLSSSFHSTSSASLIPSVSPSDYHSINEFTPCDGEGSGLFIQFDVSHSLLYSIKECIFLGCSASAHGAASLFIPDKIELSVLGFCVFTGNERGDGIASDVAFHAPSDDVVCPITYCFTLSKKDNVALCLPADASYSFSREACELKDEWLPVGSLTRAVNAEIGSDKNFLCGMNGNRPCASLSYVLSSVVDGSLHWIATIGASSYLNEGVDGIIYDIMIDVLGEDKRSTIFDIRDMKNCGDEAVYELVNSTVSLSSVSVLMRPEKAIEFVMADGCQIAIEYCLFNAGSTQKMYPLHTQFFIFVDSKFSFSYCEINYIRMAAMPFLSIVEEVGSSHEFSFFNCNMTNCSARNSNSPLLLYKVTQTPAPTHRRRQSQMQKSSSFIRESFSDLSVLVINSSSFSDITNDIHEKGGLLNTMISRTHEVFVSSSTFTSCVASMQSAKGGVAYFDCSNGTGVNNWKLSNVVFRNNAAAFGRDLFLIVPNMMTLNSMTITYNSTPKDYVIANSVMCKDEIFSVPMDLLFLFMTWSGTYFHVSSGPTAIDWINCGEIEVPCETIGYLLKRRAMVDVTFNITPLHPYYQNEPIALNRLILSGRFQNSYGDSIQFTGAELQPDYCSANREDRNGKESFSLSTEEKTTHNKNDSDSTITMNDTNNSFDVTDDRRSRGKGTSQRNSNSFNGAEWMVHANRELTIQSVKIIYGDLPDTIAVLFSTENAAATFSNITVKGAENTRQDAGLVVVYGGSLALTTAIFSNLEVRWHSLIQVVDSTVYLSMCRFDQVSLDKASCISISNTAEEIISAHFNQSSNSAANSLAKQSALMFDSNVTESTLSDSFFRIGSGIKQTVYLFVRGSKFNIQSNLDKPAFLLTGSPSKPPLSGNSSSVHSSTEEVPTLNFISKDNSFQGCNAPSSLTGGVFCHTLLNNEDSMFALDNTFFSSCSAAETVGYGGCVYLKCAENASTFTFSNIFFHPSRECVGKLLFIAAYGLGVVANPMRFRFGWYEEMFDTNSMCGIDMAQAGEQGASSKESAIVNLLDIFAMLSCSDNVYVSMKEKNAVDNSKCGMKVSTPCKTLAEGARHAINDGYLKLLDDNSIGSEIDITNVKLQAFGTETEFATIAVERLDHSFKPGVIVNTGNSSIYGISFLFTQDSKVPHRSLIYSEGIVLQILSSQFTSNGGPFDPFTFSLITCEFGGFDFLDLLVCNLSFQANVMTLSEDNTMSIRSTRFENITITAGTVLVISDKYSLPHPSNHCLAIVDGCFSNIYKTLVGTTCFLYLVETGTAELSNVKFINCSASNNSFYGSIAYIEAFNAVLNTCLFSGAVSLSHENDNMRKGTETNPFNDQISPTLHKVKEKDAALDIEMCSWSGAGLTIVATIGTLYSCEFCFLSDGALLVGGGRVLMDGNYFHDNGNPKSRFPGIHHNIICFARTSVRMENMEKGDGSLLSPSLWMIEGDCNVTAPTGSPASESLFFIPKLSSAKYSVIDNEINITFDGMQLFPCCIGYRIFSPSSPEPFIGNFSDASGGRLFAKISKDVLQIVPSMNVSIDYAGRAGREGLLSTYPIELIEEVIKKPEGKNKILIIAYALCGTAFSVTVASIVVIFCFIRRRKQEVLSSHETASSINYGSFYIRDSYVMERISTISAVAIPADVQPPNFEEDD